MKKKATLPLAIWVLMCAGGCRTAALDGKAAAIAPTEIYPDEKEAPGAVVIESPGGGHVRASLAYREHDSDRTLVIDEIDRNGKTLRRHRFPCYAADNAVMNAEWLAPRRLLVTLHVNPSLFPVIDADLDAGKAREYFGSELTYDAQLRRVAYVRDPPHFSPPRARPTLMVGDTKITDLPPGVPLLKWSTDGTMLTVALPATESNTRPQLLVVEFDGDAVVRHTWYRQAR